MRLLYIQPVKSNPPPSPPRVFSCSLPLSYCIHFPIYPRRTPNSLPVVSSCRAALQDTQSPSYWRKQTLRGLEREFGLEPADFRRDFRSAYNLLRAFPSADATRSRSVGPSQDPWSWSLWLWRGLFRLVVPLLLRLRHRLLALTKRSPSHLSMMRANRESGAEQQRRRSSATNDGGEDYFVRAKARGNGWPAAACDRLKHVWSVARAKSSRPPHPGSLSRSKYS